MISARWNRSELALIMAYTAAPAVWLACASSSLPPGDIQVTFVAWHRSPGAYGSTNHTIEVGVVSTYPVTGVTAQNVGIATSQSVAMYPAMADRWSSWLEMVTGDNLLRFHVTDEKGNVADAEILVTVDRPPVVTVLEPADSSVAQPTIYVSATCSDDLSAGCTMLTVAAVEPSCDPYLPYGCHYDRPYGEVLLQGTDTISGDVDLSAFAGLEVILYFSAEDSTQGLAHAARRVRAQAAGFAE